MRRESQRAMQRVRVQEQLQPAIASTVQTPVSAAARSGTSDAAFALAGALRGARALSARRDADLTQQAGFDFQRNTVDPNIGNKNYRNEVNRLTARARWIDDRNQLTEELKSMDLADITQDELEGFLNDRFTALYGDIDDPVVANELTPLIAGFKENAYATALETQAEAERAEISASFTKIAQDSYDAGQATKEGLDYVGLHARLKDVMPFGAQVNDLFFEIIKELAIENGDPDLIRNAPARWSDGTPSFQDDARFSEKVMNATLRAEQAQDAMLADAAEKAEAAREARLNAHGMAAVESAATGNYAGAIRAVEAYADSPGAEYTKVLALRKGLDALDDINSEQTFDPIFAGYAAIQTYQGNWGQSEILRELAMGKFGTGKQSYASALPLLKAAQTVADAGPEIDSDAYRAYNSDITRNYKPDRTENEWDETRAKLQGAALLEFHKRVYENGENPADAHFEVRNKYDDRLDRIQSVITKENSAHSAEEALQGMLDKTVSIPEAIGAGVNEELVEQLAAQGRISPERGIEILDLLDPYMRNDR